MCQCTFSMLYILSYKFCGTPSIFAPDTNREKVIEIQHSARKFNARSRTTSTTKHHTQYTHTVMHAHASIAHEPIQSDYLHFFAIVDPNSLMICYQCTFHRILNELLISLLPTMAFLPSSFVCVFHFWSLFFIYLGKNAIHLQYMTWQLMHGYERAFRSEIPIELIPHQHSAQLSVTQMVWNLFGSKVEWHHFYCLLHLLLHSISNKHQQNRRSMCMIFILNKLGRTKEWMNGSIPCKVESSNSKKSIEYWAFIGSIP